MNSIAILKRDSNKITISELFERYKLDKINLEPPYQRRGDVWDVEKQGFLIDSILKNYPVPPIFLHQKIDSETGKTMYDVIDGKQRLTAIIAFLNGELSLPQSFDEGAYGDSRLNGLKISDLEGELLEYKKQLWRYTLSVEYVDSDDIAIIDSIFDRLNRNGEPLERQELRRAQYHGTPLLQMIEEVTKIIDWNCVGNVNVARMQDQEFASELVFLVLDGEASEGNSKNSLDEKYAYWNKTLSDDQRIGVISKITDIVSFINKLSIDFDKYKLKGVSHYYALFGFSKIMIDKGENVSNIKEKIQLFYKELRNPKITNPYAIQYSESMKSNTRSKRQRDKRIDALVEGVKNI